MEPIRILHENVIMDPCGIETLLMNIYRHIDRDLIQFDFMVHRPDRAFYEDEIESLGGRIYRTPKFNPFPGPYQEFMKSVENILTAHPEYKIFHAHAELNLWPLMVATKLGIPTRIAHSHNAKSTVNLKYFFFKYEQLFIKKYCTDMFMCSTPAGEWSYGKDAVESGKVQLIKNGIDTAKFEFNESVRAKKREELNLKDKLVIGHVGRFMFQKNHSFLIDIFNEIHKINDNTVLVLVGDGELAEKIKSKVSQLGLSDSVIFVGNTSAVSDFMQAMDVFLFPSHWEGLPLTGVEAQTAGLPVIMSDVIADELCITGNTYKLSTELGAEAWAKKVLDIACSYKRTNARQAVIDAGYDICTTADWLTEFYLRKHNEVVK